MKLNKMLVAMSSVGSWTLASRVLGFVREVIFAALFGSSAIAEAFQIAFSLPNTFRRFFAEGALNMAFIPMYAKKMETQESALEFARNVFSALAIFLAFFVAIASIAMPALVWIMASGFVGDERFDLSVEYGRISFPYIFFISLAAMISGALNAHNRFATAAAAPVLLNVILISAMWFGPEFGIAPERALIWSVPFAGFCQLVLVWFALRNIGVTFSFTLPKWNADLSELARIMAPAMLAGGVLQINLIVGRQVASQFEGSIQWLAVADRMYQLPLGVVGVAIGIVLLPTLSKALAKNDQAAAQTAFNDSLMFASFLVLPATIALISVPTPIIEAMFERGAFNSTDTANAAAALAIYGCGVPAFVAQKLYQPSFFSRGDTKTPFRFALYAMVLNAVLAVGLMPWFEYLAAAIATTASAYLMLVLLVLKARQFGDETVLKAAAIRSILASIFASAVIGLSFVPIRSYAEIVDLNKYAELGLYVLAGLAITACLAALPENRKLLRR